MARKMYTRDSSGNIVLKEQGASGPVYNIPEPISRVGKIIPQLYKDIKSGEGASEAITSTIEGLLNAVKQERRKGITKYNMEADPEPNVNYDSYGEETSGYYDYSGETSGDVNVYDTDTDYSGYTDVLEGPIENKPIDPVEVNKVLNKFVPKSDQQNIEDIVLKGKERYEALESAGVFPDVIDWAMNNKHLPGLSSKTDSFFEKIASGDMSPREYKIIMRALHHAYDTRTANKETYDLFKRLIPIYTIKPNA